MGPRHENFLALATGRTSNNWKSEKYLQKGAARSGIENFLSSSRRKLIPSMAVKTPRVVFKVPVGFAQFLPTQIVCFDVFLPCRSTLLRKAED